MCGVVRYRAFIMKSSILWVLCVIGVVYMGLCVYLFAMQRSLIYFPVGADRDVPADDLRIPSGGESLQVWNLSPGQPKALIYFGGNAENVSQNLPAFAEFFPDYSLYLVNYRGYAQSTGSPTEDALYADALSVYEHVRRKHTDVAVIGRSLGSGVATYLAAQRPVERLALVTPFDSLVNVAQSAYPFMPVSLFLRDRYDSLGRAPSIAAPTLILMAARDRIIPARRSEALVAGFAPAQVVVKVIDDADHNTIGQFADYGKALSGFFQGPHGT